MKTLAMIATPTIETAKAFMASPPNCAPMWRSRSPKDVMVVTKDRFP
jgi:hypothetical protein